MKIANQSGNGSPPVKLSVVTTLYHSAPYLEEFHARVTATASKITDAYEIILVNDASPDSSIEIALSLFKQDQHVRVIDLARNYRHHRAVMTGLTAARGDWVYKIDCDLEDQPEWLEDFVALTKADSTLDVIYGVQAERRGNRLQSFVGECFYTAFNWLADTTIPRNAVSAWLMSRSFVNGLTAHRERDVFLAGLLAETGFQKRAVPVQKLLKKATTYTWRKRVRLLLSAVTSFSDKPLTLIAYLGTAIIIPSSVATLTFTVRQVLFGSEGATSWLLISTIWLVGGLVIGCMGILGIYLSKIYAVIRQIYEHEPHTPMAPTLDRVTANQP